MAEFVDRVKLIFDVVGDQATSSVRNMKDEVGNAEGAFGKLKAGASGAADAIGANLGLSLTAVAGAAVAFGTKAVGAFQDLALSAGDLAVKMGMSSDEASRWMEVASDLGVNMDAVAGASARLNKEAGQGKLAQYGIDAQSSNDRLLQTIDYLNKIQDPAERAAKGAELLGKSWTQIAPLVDQASQLRDRLSEVSSQKVIDSGELANARQFRDSMDELHDTADDLTLTVGQGLVPALNDLLKAVSPVVQAIDKASSLTIPFTNGMDLMTASVNIATTPFRVVGDAFSLWSGGADDAKKSTDDLKNSTEDATAPTDDLADSVDKLNQKLDDLAGKALSGMEANLKLRQSTLDLQFSLQNAGADTDKLKQKTIDFAQELVKDRGTPAAISSLQAMKAYVAPGSEMDRYLDNVIGQLEDIEGTHTAKVNADTSQAMKALQDLNSWWSRTLTAPFTPKVSGSAVGAAAPSGSSSGPQLFGADVAAGGTVALSPMLELAGGDGPSGTTIINHWPVGVDARSVVIAQRRWAGTAGTVNLGATGL